MIEYIVQKNDTIPVVKERFNVTWKEIQSQNPYAVGKIGETGHWFLKEGAKLTFENTNPGMDAATFQDQLKLSSQRVVHKVRAGDTLWGLSKTYGVDVAAIADLNGLRNPDLIRVGQVLSIPEIKNLNSDKELEAGGLVSPDSPAAKVGEGNAYSPDARSVEKECLKALAGDIMPMPLYTGELSIPEHGPKAPHPEGNAGAESLFPKVDETKAAAISAPGVNGKTGIDLPYEQRPDATPGRFSVTSHRLDGSSRNQIRIQYGPSRDTKLFLGLDLERYRKSAYVDKESDPDLSVLVGISLNF